MASKEGGDLMPILLIGGAIAAVVWLANKNKLPPPGAATSGAALPPGATSAAGTTAGFTSGETSPVMQAINTVSEMAAGQTGLTTPINTGATY